MVVGTPRYLNCLINWMVDIASFVCVAKQRDYSDPFAYLGERKLVLVTFDIIY